MEKNVEAIANTIRSNATNLINTKNIVDILGRHGEVLFTGSYELDLMTWYDIDVQIVLSNAHNPLETFNSIQSELCQDKDFVEAQLINFTGTYKSKMPRGIYLGLKFISEEQGEWKMDIWSLGEKDFRDNRELLEKLKAKLIPHLRTLILEVKHEMMKGSDRVPQMGSHLLYQEVLLNGNHDKESLLQLFRP